MSIFLHGRYLKIYYFWNDLEKCLLFWCDFHSFIVIQHFFSHDGRYSFWKYWPQFKSPYLNFIRSIYIFSAFAVKYWHIEFQSYICAISLLFPKKDLFSACFKDNIFTFLLKCILYVRICFCFLILHFNVWLIAISDCISWISTKDSFSVYCYFIIIKGNFWLSSLTKWPSFIESISALHPSI